MQDWLRVNWKWGLYQAFYFAQGDCNPSKGQWTVHVAVVNQPVKLNYVGVRLCLSGHKQGQISLDRDFFETCSVEYSGGVLIVYVRVYKFSVFGK